MTRNNKSYRTQGRAVLLAAIMVLSMLALPFAGGAAAVSPSDLKPSLDNDAAPYDTNVTDGDRVYEGQIVVGNLTEDFHSENNGEIDLATRDDGEYDEFISLEDVLDQDADEDTVTLDTEDLDAGRYTLTNASEGDSLGGGNTFSINFTLTEQQLSAEFDEDTATDSGADSEVEFEVESRQRNNYAINVSADGLDGEDLAEIFNGSDQLGPNVGPSDTGGNDELVNRSAIANNVSHNSSAVGYAIIDDDEDVLTILDGEQTFDTDFDNQDVGEYEFEVNVLDSSASATDEIEVVDEGDADATITDIVEPAQGDWAEITTEFENADNGHIAIGELDEDGYQYNVTVDDVGDDDEVTIYFNTYLAGQEDDTDVTNEDIVVLSDDSDDADVEISVDAGGGEGENSDSPSDILDTGSYDVAVEAAPSNLGDHNDANTFDDADDIDSLFINERADSPSVNLWTASADNAGDIEELEDLEAAIEDGELTETDTIADSDALFHEIDADGLSGLIANDSSYDHDEEDVTEAFTNSITPNEDRDFDGSGTNTTTNFSVTLEQESPSSNRDPIQLNLSQNTVDEMSVLYDKEANTFYAHYEISEVEFNRGAGTSNVDIDDEEDMNAEVTIKDARLLDEDVDDFSSARDYEDNAWETASQPVEYVEADGDFDLGEYEDDEYVLVANAEDQEVSGEVNVAPGSELTVRLRGTDGASFVKSNDVTVDSDRTFSDEFDFSDRDVDDEFDARLRLSGSTINEEDGLVIEDAPEDDEADDEDDVVDDEDDVVDDEDDVVDDEDDAVDDTADDVDDETPGFGAIVALVALIGAALLAVRRQN